MITKEEFPVGTRIISTLSGRGGEVAGWVRDSISIRWNDGGTHCAPASHGGIRHDDEMRDL